MTLADNFALAGATLYSTQWKTNVNNGKKEMSIGSNYYDGIIPALKADGTSPRAYEEYTYTFDVYGLLSEAPAGHLLCGGLRLRHEPVCLSRDPA